MTQIGIIQIMNIRGLDLNLLLVFEAIYSTGNISRAAEQLDLSQPAMSNALARLRKQLDDQLFVRSGNGVIPTSRGEEIIEPIRKALSTIREGIGAEAAFDPQTSRRHFRLIVADPLERIVMPRLLRSIGAEAQITFELLPVPCVNVEEALLGGKADMAVFLMPGHYSELHDQPLCPVDLVVLARQGHPRIEGSITREAFMDERRIAMNLTPGKISNSEKVTDWRHAWKHKVCEVYKISSIAQLVAETDLIGVVPRIYAEQVAEAYGLQIVPLPIQGSNQHYHMIWHRRFDSDKGHVWLREAAAAAVTEAYKRLVS